MSIREIARTFHHSRRKIREVLSGSGEPKPYRKRKNQAAPKLGAFHETILQILKDDKSAPPKQRHTIMRIFERLTAEHGYQGSYSTVRRFLIKHRQEQRETFIPLDHQPGQRIEADFGEIQVDFPNGRRKVNVLILVWSYSNAPFAIAFPTQRTEAILEGMTQAFDFFHCVPKEVWWDNPKTVADAILSSRSRRINRRYAALASHYVFEPLFCLPARGNEKPVVENRVKTLQRKWSTPVPKVKDFEELNAILRERCLEEQKRIGSGQSETIGRRLEQDKQHAIALPNRRFDPCIRRDAKVNKYQFARFDNVNYSVPRHGAFQTVSVKGYVDRVEIVFQDAVIATHPRSYEKGDQVLDPLHYLITLGRRPSAVDHSNVYRQWKLPQVFDELRESLEHRHGSRAGVKQYVRVLQLLVEHPLWRVRQSIEQLRGREGADAERIVRRVERSAERTRHHVESSRTTLSSKDLESEELSRPEILSVQVPCPSLNHFDRFLSSSIEGVHDHDQTQKKRPPPNVVAEQPQETQASHDECGVPEAGRRGGGLESDIRAVPASTDRTGSDGPVLQRFDQSDQTGSVSRREGSGELRFLCDSVGEQTEGAGTGPLRMDRATCQCLPDRPTGNGENASGDCLGFGRLP